MILARSSLVAFACVVCIAMACNGGAPSGGTTTGTTSIEGSTTTEGSTSTTASVDDATTMASTTTTTSSSSGADSTSTTGMPPDACACFEHHGGGLGYGYFCGSYSNCGAYIGYDGSEFTQDPCADEGGSGGSTGGSSGGSTSGGLDPECEALMAANAEVVECVVAAAAAGGSFEFHHSINPGDIFSSDRHYWLPGDGTMAISWLDWNDLCYEEWADLREAPELSGCDAWECIANAVGASGSPCLSDEDCPKG